NQFAYFNIPGWWDDTCCGEIDVTVTLKDGTVLSTRDNVKSATDERIANCCNAKQALQSHLNGLCLGARPRRPSGSCRWGAKANT
ncbi:hypothetical protein, partial [Nitrobacter vulgaris]